MGRMDLHLITFYYQESFFLRQQDPLTFQSKIH